MHLADASVFIACVMILAVFDVSKAVENGKVVEPKIQYTTGTVRCARAHSSCGDVPILLFMDLPIGVTQSPRAIQVLHQATLLKD